MFRDLQKKEAVKKVEDSFDEYELRIAFKDNAKETLSGEDIEYYIDPADDVKAYLEEQHWYNLAPSLFNKTKYNTSGTMSYNKEKLKNALENLPEFQEENITRPADAYLEEKDGQYIVVSEVEGNALDFEKVYSVVCDCVDRRETFVDTVENDCYIKPSVYSDNENLLSVAGELNSLIQGTVTYILPSQEEMTLDTQTLKSWLVQDENGHYHKDEALWNQKINEYVDALAEKVDTLGEPVEFPATTGEKVMLNSLCGWKVDREAEVAQLTADLSTNGNEKREPIYSSRGYSGRTPAGDTYVEINLTQQHMWVYDNEVLFMETDVVSGKMTHERYTPAGIFYLQYKQQDRYLRGPQREDGSYEWDVHVDYWMPFYNGCGMHDAYWQSVFGGSAYVSGGSRGCINMPFSQAKKLYEWISVGTPVVCYYTEELSFIS